MTLAEGLKPDKTDIKIYKAVGIGAAVGLGLVAIYFLTRKAIQVLREKSFQKVVNNFGTIIKRYAKTYGVEPHLIAAVIVRESSPPGNPNSYRYEPKFYTQLMSKSGWWTNNKYYNQPEIISASYGLMQVMYTTAYEIAPNSTIKNSIANDYTILYNPEYNIMLGTLKLKKCLNDCGGNVESALAKYNGGIMKDTICIPSGASNSYVSLVTNAYNTTSKDIWDAVT